MAAALVVGAPAGRAASLEAAVNGSVLQDPLNAHFEFGFTDTLSFPTSGPVADLPPGYTLDGPDVYVNDNAFGVVPEPGAYAALAALGCLDWAAWRRSGRRQP